MLTQVKDNEIVTLISSVEKNHEAVQLKRIDTEEQVLFTVSDNSGVVYFTQYKDASEYIDALLSK